MPVAVLADSSSEKNAKSNGCISISEDAIVDVKVTTRFSPEDVLSAFISSPQFRKIIMTGKYVYIDGYIVVNSPECLRLQRRQVRVHQVALSNPDVYLLQKKSITVYDEDSDSEKVYTLIAEAAKVDSVKKFDKDTIALVIGYGDGDSGEDPPRSALNRTMRKEMSIRGITEEWLAEESGISVKTVQRMRNDSEYRPSLQSIVAVCLGMHLNPYNSLNLLDVAGYRLTDLTIERIYLSLVTTAYQTSMKEINDALKRLGYPTFVDKE